MAKFDIKTVKPKFVVTTSPENKIDVVVNKPIIETKLSKSFFKLKNTGGPAGQPGRDGQDGQSATIEVASTTTLPAGSSATVENVGTDSAARLAFGIPKGDTGAAGADGDAATIQVGQVETLQPNQPAYVQNVGTSAAAIFNIGIPKGEKGDSGSGSGDMTASTYDPNGTVAAAGGIPDYVDSNGGKIDTIKVNGTTQTITNKTVDLSVPTKTSDVTNDSGYITSASLPTKTSDLTNDGSDGTSTYVEADELPAVNDATLTITQNGTSAGTFTANASSNTTIALTDTTYNVMTGASSSAAGTSGLVPAPSAGDQNDVLKGDGTWGLIGAYNLDDFSTANTADTWMLVGSNEKIQHRVVKPFNADGSIPTSAIADGAVTADKLANTDSWVLLGEMKTTQISTGTFLSVSIPAAYGNASLKVSAKFEMSDTSGGGGWVDLRTLTANGTVLNCVSGITVLENGTIAANSSNGQFSSYYIVNATDSNPFRCWNIQAESVAPNGNWRTWLGKSGNGRVYNNVSANSNTGDSVTSIVVVTDSQAEAGAILKVWGRID